MHQTQQPIPLPRPALRGEAAQRDDTTRYLCAGAHLDCAFADEAIKEFLVEPSRQMPPTPGVYPPAVLGEAVAARTRRKLRDAALAVLMVVFVVVAPAAVTLSWLSLAVLVVLPRLFGRARRRGASGKTYFFLLVLLVALAVGAVNGLTDVFSGAAFERSGRSSGPDLIDYGSLIPAIASFVAMLVVLAVDRFVVWRLVTVRFGRSAPPPPADPLAAERTIFSLSPPRFVQQLRRHVHEQPVPPGAVPLVVYRGYDPFVGDGGEHSDSAWSVVIPLERRADAATAHPLATEVLYDRIREEISHLVRATPLAPGGRLGRLRIGGQVVVSAQELVDHLNEPTSREFLPHLAGPPSPGFPAADDRGLTPEQAQEYRRARVAELRANPQEWARYYDRFQVETWDGDLVLTVHVHVALDDTTLYVEWSPCVLLPIDPAFQSIDSFAVGVLTPVRQTLLRLVKLPVTVLGRAWHTATWFRPTAGSTGRVYPESYGSLRSLREMAAGTDVHNYFQLTDVDRYLKILHSRYVRAVSALLHEHGYSPATFQEQAVTVNHNNIHIGGSMAGNVVLGSGNVVGSVTSIEEYR